MTRSDLQCFELWPWLVLVRPQGKNCTPTIAVALIVKEALDRRCLYLIRAHKLDNLGAFRHIGGEVADHIALVSGLDSIPVRRQTHPLVFKTTIRADFFAPRLPLGQPRFQCTLHSLAAVDTCRFRFQEVKKSHLPTLQREFRYSMIAVLLLGIAVFATVAYDDWANS
jgi:hypothetical protein